MQFRGRACANVLKAWGSGRITAKFKLSEEGPGVQFSWEV